VEHTIQASVFRCIISFTIVIIIANRYLKSQISRDLLETNFFNY